MITIIYNPKKAIMLCVGRSDRDKIEGSEPHFLSLRDSRKYRPEKIESNSGERQ